MTDIPENAIPGVIPANCCYMPTPCDPREAVIYRKFREKLVSIHCADDRPHHKCADVISLDRTSITLNCPRCGDLRKIIESTNGR